MLPLLLYISPFSLEMLISEVLIFKMYIFILPNNRSERDLRDQVVIFPAGNQKHLNHCRKIYTFQFKTTLGDFTTILSYPL